MFTAAVVCFSACMCVSVCFPGNVNVKESGFDDDADDDDEDNVQKTHYILNLRINH